MILDRNDSLVSNSSCSSFMHTINDKKNLESIKISLKRIKKLFLIFLRQFDTQEYNLLVKYLRYLLNKFNKEPNKIFNILLASKEKEPNAKCSKLPKILKAESVSNLNEPNDESFQIDENDLLNKSDLIKSFVVSDENESLDDSNLENDYNYYHNKLESNSNSSSFEDGDDEEYEDLEDQEDAENKKNQKTRIKKFNQSISNELERKFALNNFISGNERKTLAKKLNLTERQVQKWFVHRREKQRRVSDTKQKKVDTKKPNKQNKDETDSVSSEQNKENKQTESLKPTNEQPSPIKTRTRNNRRKLVDSLEEAVVGDVDQQQTTTQTRRVNSRRHSLLEKQDQETNKKEPDVKSPPAKRVCNTTRKSFSQEILTKLEDFFNKHNFLDDKQVDELIKQTGLNEKQIKSWFKAKRHKLKIEKKGPRVRKSKSIIEEKESEEDEESNEDEAEIDLIPNSDLSSDLNSDLTENLFMNNFSKAANQELENSFQKSKYLTLTEKKNLCSKLNLKNIDVERWFYFRRKQK